MCCIWYEPDTSGCRRPKFEWNASRLRQLAEAERRIRRSREMDNNILKILACPITKVPVRMLPQEQLVNINNQIEHRLLRYYDGSIVEDSIENALVTENGKIIYRIDDGIPIMVAPKGIQLAIVVW